MKQDATSVEAAEPLRRLQDQTSTYKKRRSYKSERKRDGLKHHPTPLPGVRANR